MNAELMKAIGALHACQMKHGDVCAQVAEAESKGDEAALDRLNEPEARAVSAVNEAERRVASIPAGSLSDAIQKIECLSHESVNPDLLRAACAELKPYLARKSDPIIPLCQKVLNLYAFTEDRAHVKGDVCVEIDQALDARFALENEIAKMTPQTPEGLAFMAEVLWKNLVPSFDIGSDEWLDDAQEASHQIMAGVLNGARIMASRA